jgi:hypothetical protein
MKNIRLVGIAAVALMTAACAPRTTREVGGDVTLDAAATGGAWTTNLKGMNGWERVRGSAFAQLRDKGTRVALTIERGFAGSNYGWDVREGTCAAPGAVVGEADSYPPLFIGEDERDSRVADLEIALQRGKPYAVRVYSTPVQSTTTIACGALQM